MDKVEAKYYADGEDAYHMRMELGGIREAVNEEKEGDGDEGEAVGSEGQEEKKRKVKVGRGLGVGELVEKNEAADAAAAAS